MIRFFKSPYSKLKSQEIQPWLFNTLFVILLVGPYNYPLWQYMLHLYPLHEERALSFLAMVFIVLSSFYYIVLTIFSIFRLQKPIAIFVVLANAVVLYFMNHFAVVIDDTMIQNVLQTDPNEAKEIVGASISLYIVLAGLVPAAIIYSLKINYPKNLKSKIVSLSTIIIPLALIGLIAATQFQSFASFVRNHKDVRYHILPNNYVNALYKTAKNHLISKEQEIIPLIEASKDPMWQNHTKKTLFVFVVGETARADNFSLNGYNRETNPLLKEKHVLNFKDMHSCGTATAVSLPCMFSSVGRKKFDMSFDNPNNLFQLINRAGFKTAWIDNNSGCKGLCNGLPTVETKDLLKYNQQEPGEVYDMTMLQAFDEKIKSSKEDTFIVLHQKGSHGPAYYARTPESFRKFKPLCMTEELTKCSQEEIRNSYDNTILYTDYFLSNVIDRLQGLSRDYNTAMIYVSDHGESLGENNLYLHGLPYMIAPDQQKHVPFVMWMSEGFMQQQHVDKYCMSKKVDEPFTHDNLFHSILSILDIDTSLKDEGLNLFSRCRDK